MTPAAAAVSLSESLFARSHPLIDHPPQATAKPTLTKPLQILFDTKIMEMKNRSKNSQPPAPQQAPWLVFVHGKGEKSQTFFNVSDGTYIDRSIPEMCQTVYLASYFGWLVMQDKTSEDLFLLHAVTLQKILLPKLCCSLYKCVLSCPPTEPDCVVIFHGFSDSDSFMYCHPGGNQWYERQYKTGEADEAIFSVVSCNGKLYCEGSSGRLGIIDVVADPPVTWVERVFTDRPRERMLATYLMESCGDIFYIVIGYFLSVPRVTDFSVYKCDLDKMVITKVDTLGDRVLFLGAQCCTSCSASVSGMEKDCVYFLKRNDRNLYVFHMDRGTVSVHLPCPKVRSPWNQPFWIMPSVTDSL